jgi:phosphate/sulfate permease
VNFGSGGALPPFPTSAKRLLPAPFIRITEFVTSQLIGSNPGVPFWIVLSCHVAMALGTLIGGWRIVRTMGSRITRLKPVQGFCAETAGAATLYLTTSLGVPVSTTHTLTGLLWELAQRGESRRSGGHCWQHHDRMVGDFARRCPDWGVVLRICNPTLMLFPLQAYLSACSQTCSFMPIAVTRPRRGCDLLLS